jgi:protein-S-isoprenylcysteine O-methyltransferase Ste14
MKRLWVRNWRINTTRALIALLIVFLFISGSVWDERGPVVAIVLFVVGCVMATLGVIGRLWCAIYIGGYKTQNLITVGPYSICRNPLYFFSFIGSVGAGLTSETITIGAILAIGFLLIYPKVIGAEEVRLRKVHGRVYEEYARRTPRFFPRWSLLVEPDEYVTHPVMFRRHAFSAMWFIWIIVILEVIEGLREMDLLKPLFMLY